MPVVFSVEEITARAGFKRASVEGRVSVTGRRRMELLRGLPPERRAAAARGELIFLNGTTATDGRRVFIRCHGNPERMFLGTELLIGPTKFRF